MSIQPPPPGYSVIYVPQVVKTAPTIPPMPMPGPTFSPPPPMPAMVIAPPATQTQTLSADELNKAKNRWFPKQLFNRSAPPGDRLADPWRVGVLTGFIAFGLAGYTLSPLIGLVGGALGYMIQSQTNRDALSKIQVPVSTTRPVIALPQA